MNTSLSTAIRAMGEFRVTDVSPRLAGNSTEKYGISTMYGLSVKAPEAYRQVEFFDPEDAAVIREVYDGENAHDVFAEELERALDAAARVIIIEPPRLGDETARWIAVGNCLHKTAVISGLGAIACGIMSPHLPLTYTPLVVTSVFCTSLYTVSWQFDPCVKYQVFTDSKRLTNLPLFSRLSSATPIVLVRQDDTRRKLLHCSVTLAASALVALKLYRLFN